MLHVGLVRRLRHCDHPPAEDEPGWANRARKQVGRRKATRSPLLNSNSHSIDRNGYAQRAHMPPGRRTRPRAPMRKLRVPHGSPRPHRGRHRGRRRLAGEAGHALHLRVAPRGGLSRARPEPVGYALRVWGRRVIPAFALVVLLKFLHAYIPSAPMAAAADAEPAAAAAAEPVSRVAAAARRVADTLCRGADPATFFRDDGTLRIYPSVLLEACGLAGVSVLDVCRRPRRGEDALSDEDVINYLLSALYSSEPSEIVINSGYMVDMGLRRVFVDIDQRYRVRAEVFPGGRGVSRTAVQYVYLAGAVHRAERPRPHRVRRDDPAGRRPPGGRSEPRARRDTLTCPGRSFWTSPRGCHRFTYPNP